MESKQSKEVACNDKESNHQDIPTKIRKPDNGNCDSNQGSGSDNGIARNFDNVCEIAEAEEVNPCTSQTPEDFVYSIDHILESIFSDLDQDRNTLLSCRLVSRRWAYFATQELQKIVTITFTMSDVLDQRNGPRFCKCDRYGYNPSLNYPIVDLTRLMNSSTQFPCTSFSFKRPNLIYSLALPFFNHHIIMSTVKKLRLGDLSSDCSIYFEDLKWLCLSQAPNLEHLCLESDIVPGKSPAQIYFLSHQKEKFVNEEESKNVKTNLKVLKIKKLISMSLFAELLEFSPRLAKVQLDRKRHFSCLLKPQNRLHLLSKLKISVDPLDMLRLNTIVNDSNWALQKLAIDSTDVSSRARELAHPQSMLLAITNVLSKLLQANSASLKKLVWDQMECLKSLVIPHMPAVTEIEFSIQYNTESDYEIDEEEGYRQDIAYQGKPGKLFPIGVNIQATFPNLKNIHFCSKLGTRVSVASLFHKLEPIPSVVSCSFSGSFRPDFETFRALMPNSKFNLS